MVEPTRLRPFIPSEKVILGGEQVTGVLVRHYCDPRDFLGIEVEKVGSHERTIGTIHQYVSRDAPVALNHTFDGSVFTDWFSNVYEIISRVEFSAPGDSGAPVIYRCDNKVFLVGAIFLEGMVFRY